MGNPKPEASEVTAFASLIRFHQKICFYSETTKSDVRVTYAVAGSQAENAPAILFAGGMYGGRWNAQWIDHLCEKKGVRVILVDR